MSVNTRRIGIIGGTGMLGGAIAQGLLDRKAVPAADLWVSNRSGSRAGLEQFPQVNVTTDNAELSEACEIIILSLPPALAREIALSVPERLVISVMAGVTIEELQAITRSRNCRQSPGRTASSGP